MFQRVQEGNVRKKLESVQLLARILTSGDTGHGQVMAWQIIICFKSGDLCKKKGFTVCIVSERLLSILDNTELSRDISPRYRSIDGTCNNLGQSRWGQHSEYPDGIVCFIRINNLFSFLIRKGTI